MADKVRYPLILWEALRVLRDSPESLSYRIVIDAVRERIQPTAYELEQVKNGARWEIALHFLTGDAATIGWMSKRGGWTLSEAGAAALDAYPSPEAMYAERNRRYREIDQQRKQAQEHLSDVHQFIAETLRALQPGYWTAFDDLAELAGTTAEDVAHFLAGWQVKLDNSYRVLTADGAIPPEGMLHAAYRGTDLQARLAGEGVAFDAGGRASQAQRVTAEALKDLLRVRDEGAQGESTAAARRAWMVRGFSVEGYNLVQQWLAEGFVSLSASQLGTFDPTISADELRRAVDRGYDHKSYAYREQRLAEFDRFLHRMGAGDLVITTSSGKVHVGVVDGPASHVDSPSGLSNMRRDVRWDNPDEGIAADRLRPPVPALLQDQSHVVDLTQAYEQLAGLITIQPAEPPRKPLSAQKELAFRPVTAAFADALLMDEADLAKIADLLWERKQIILYGPPGTGKTWLARKLARHLADDIDGAVRLVQFHPSYTYEDFFEGFRPKAEGGGLSFELRPGPFRAFAEAAEDDQGTPYILVIDEINRANLAKVFGELYFLLEYRDESISLQYSPHKPFSLPPNLFIIGTMNTADRSIARLDAAMRRRFAFVRLDPRVPPVAGLLHRWLADHELPGEAALLLDALNARIEDADAAIGPSHLMRKEIYAQTDGLERVWEHSIMPLLEDLFYGEPDLADRYGLAALRKAVGAAGLAGASEPDPA